MQYDSSNKLGETLRQRRLERGLSMGEVGRRAAIDMAVVSRIERGLIRQPDPRKIARLARVLDLPLTRLYTLAGYPAGRQLPSFQPYLRDRYRHLPSEARDKLTDYFREIEREYGSSDGPAPGEDEQPE